MKHIAIVLLVSLFSLPAQAQLKPISSEPADSGNTYMLSMSANSLDKAGLHGNLSILLGGVAIGTLIGGNRLETNGILNGNGSGGGTPLFILAGLSSAVSLGLNISHHREIRKSGYYLRAYLGGVIITF
jgi:hypothetical protein